MAAPNIVNVATITGKTAVANVTTIASDIVTNSAASGKVFKINSLIISNIDGANTADITANCTINIPTSGQCYLFYNSTGQTHIASNLTLVAAGATNSNPLYTAVFLFINRYFFFI